jgi:hypothetical protein
MDWNGILGIVIALGIIQTLKARKTPMLVPALSATPGKVPDTCAMLQQIGVTATPPKN